MQTLVIDSSVIIKWLNQDDELHIDKADTILNYARSGHIELITPELAKYEVGNVLLHKKQITPTQARQALYTLYLLPLVFVAESQQVAMDTFEFANRLKITYYDASFLSLAHLYKASLVTDNIKHQKNTNEVNVIALKDYK